MGERVVKTAYAVPCASAFRGAVEALAARRGVNLADLARSILLTLPMPAVRAAVDPGEPESDDREAVVVKSGAAAGRVWRRKPRLQLRLPAGLDAATIRRALGLALALDRGEFAVGLEKIERASEAEITGLRDELERLRGVVASLAFDPLSSGVRTRGEALHVLGFPPTRRPATDIIRARYRALAAIHHPDNEFGDHQRMSQLNAAMDILSRPII